MLCRKSSDSWVCAANAASKKLFEQRPYSVTKKLKTLATIFVGD